MMWEAIGALALVGMALLFIAIMLAYRAGKRDGVEEYKAGMSERRAVLRAEARARTLPAHPDPFPAEWNERLADTGELRALAETGDLEEIERMNAEFMRVFDLWSWTKGRKGMHAA